MQNTTMCVKDLYEAIGMFYKCKLVEWMEVCCEQGYKRQIYNKIPDQVFLQTPLSIATSIRNSDENMMCEKVETLG